MADRTKSVPDSSAVRVALWRALHALHDPPPHVLEDQLGLALIAPEDGWQERPDMSPFTRPFRASIVARARFVEDHVEEQLARGVEQYVILGAGLDTFAERRPDVAGRLRLFEVDEPKTHGAAAQRQRAGEGLGSVEHAGYASSPSPKPATSLLFPHFRAAAKAPRR